MFLLTCHVCSYTDDHSTLDDLGQEFLTDPANAHLFPVLEDPEIPEIPEPQSEPAPPPKPAKKRKRAAKAGGDVATARKKKEPELV